MATESNTIETKVTLDASQAQEQIVKLNAVASDGTKTLEERIAAKNKQTELQEKLNKQTIAGLEAEKKALTGVSGKEKELDKVSKKLNATKLKTIKQETALIKQSNGLQKAYNAQKGAVNKLDNATGGMITSMKALAANPIVLFVTALVGLFKLLKEAFTSSEEGQNKWNKAMAVVNTLLGNLLDLVADATEALIWLFTNPREALKQFGDFIKENISNRIEGLMELIPKLGDAITLVFSGKFKEAGKVAVDAMGKVTLGVNSVTESIELAGAALDKFIEDQKREAKLSAQVADARAKADIIERNLIIEKSVQEAKIAELRLKAKSEEKFSAKERKVFLAEALALGDELLAKETEYLELRRDAQILENTFSRSNKENLTAEAEAIAAVNNKLRDRQNLARQIETENKRVTGQIRTEAARAKKAIDAEAKAKAKAREVELKAFAKNRADLDKIESDAKERKKEEAIKDAEDARMAEAEEAQRNRDARTELDLLEIERLREKGESTLLLEEEFIIRSRDQLLENETLTKLEILAINKIAQQEIDNINKDAREAQIRSDKQMIAIGLNMAGDAFGVAQELAVARMVMAAPEAIGNVWTQAAKQPTLPQVALHGGVGTAMVVAPIIKGLSAIKKARFPGGSKSGRGGGGGQTISAPQGAATTAITDLSANNAANVSQESQLNSSATAAAANSVNGNTPSSVVFSEGQYNDFQNQVDFAEGQTTVD